MIGEFFKFEISRESKLKAKKRRIRNEKLFRYLRISSLIMLLLFTIMFSVKPFFTIDDDRVEFIYLFVCFSFPISAIAMMAIVSGLGSRWIDDRLNEKIWIKDGKMYHFLQKAFSSGLAYRTADESAILLIMELDSIKDALYDQKSGRLEFNASGKVIIYKDYKNEVIDKECELGEKFRAKFYDYALPSLYEYLISKGFTVKKCKIKYKFDGSI